jgi:hypothetical protein
MVSPLFLLAMTAAIACLFPAILLGAMVAVLLGYRLLLRRLA